MRFSLVVITIKIFSGWKFYFQKKNIEQYAGLLYDVNFSHISALQYDLSGFQIRI